MNMIFALGVTLLAGLSTGIGAGLALVGKGTGEKFLSVSLGFSAGVMIYVSMVELFAKARQILCQALGNGPGERATALSFFCGMFAIAVIDRLIPFGGSAEEHRPGAERGRILRTGLLMALSIGIHNFPEGLATFIAALRAPALAMPIAVAIAIHNIPEGIAVSVPVYYATGNRARAFWYGFLSGLAEPAGALIGYLVLFPFLNDLVFGLLFGGVAGIMVFISLEELLPAARAYGETHLSMYGLVGGMIVMAVSLLMME